MTKEGTRVTVTGEVTDVITHVDTGEVEVRKGHNIVVNSFSNLVMALMSNKSGFSGITHWAVGSGLSSWDTNPVSPTLSEVKLTSEIGRKALTTDSFTFLTSDGSVSATPTNILKVSVTFDVDECNGTWREFGIFGGNASDSLNSGVMIDKRHHEVLTKNNTMAIERTVIFTLNLA